MLNIIMTFRGGEGVVTDMTLIFMYAQTNFFGENVTLRRRETRFQLNAIMTLSVQKSGDVHLPMELCDVILQTNRARCALNMEILDLLNEESITGASSGRASM